MSDSSATDGAFHHALLGWRRLAFQRAFPPLRAIPERRLAESRFLRAFLPNDR